MKLSHDPHEFKRVLYEQCLKLVKGKLDTLNAAYTEASEALQAESRSTAGDKHETGRAMIQLEQEKMGRQLKETQKLEQMLARVPHARSHSQVESGALVQTEKDIFFVAAGLGTVRIGETEVIVLAPASPLAQAILRKRAGDSVEFNSSIIRIVSVY